MIVRGVTSSKKAHTDVKMHINLQGNSADENVNRCCEVLELNNAIQKQLFSILNETSQGGKLIPCLITYTFHMCHFFQLWPFLYVFLPFLNVCVFLDDCAAKIKGCLLPSICCTASGSDNLTQVCKKLILRE